MASFPWKHFQITGNPEDWEWSIADQPGCPCNRGSENDQEPKPHDCYSV